MTISDTLVDLLVSNRRPLFVSMMCHVSSSTSHWIDDISALVGRTMGSATEPLRTLDQDQCSLIALIDCDHEHLTFFLERDLCDTDDDRLRDFSLFLLNGFNWSSAWCSMNIFSISSTVPGREPTTPEFSVNNFCMNWYLGCQTQKFLPSSCLRNSALLTRSNPPFFKSTQKTQIYLVSLAPRLVTQAASNAVCRLCNPLPTTQMS